MTFQFTAKGIKVNGQLVENATRSGVAEHIKLMLGMTN